MSSPLFQSPRDLWDVANAPADIVDDEAPEESEEDAESFKFHITPNSPQQHAFVTDLETSMVAAVGGIGSGKTTALGFFIPMQMYLESGTGTLGGIFANTYRQLEQSTLPGLWEVFRQMGLDDGRDYVYNKEPPRSWSGFHSQFKKHNGVLSVRAWGQAVVRSLENFNSVRGLNLGWAAIDELRDARHEAFLVVLGRVRCPKANNRRIRIATSPCGFNWIYKELVENAPKMPPDAQRRVIHMPTSCNPDLPDSYVKTLRASFDSKYAEQELEGMFVSVTVGAVYHQFKRAVHVDPSIVADPSLPFLVTFDFNRSPFCVEIGQAQISPMGRERLVMIDEVIGQDVGTEDMVERVAEKIRSYCPDPDVRPTVEVYGDPAGNQRRTSSNNRSDYDVIERDLPRLLGPFVRRYRRRSFPVMETVNAVNALMRGGADRFGIHPRCQTTIRDFESVKWKPGTSEIDKNTDKTLTHASDGVRYLIGERYPIRIVQVGRIWT